MPDEFYLRVEVEPVRDVYCARTDLSACSGKEFGSSHQPRGDTTFATPDPDTTPRSVSGKRTETTSRGRLHVPD
jgi:hypothetical protein